MLIMARRNKKPAEHENHERWLLTYADLITLLLIFFVIMYSMSKVDIAKYTVIAQALKLQFKSGETFIPKGTTGNNDPGKGKEGDMLEIVPNSEMDKMLQDMKKLAQQQLEKELQDKKELELQDVLKKVQQYISDNKLDPQVSAKDTVRGIAITLNDLFLFDSGKADLKPASYPILDKLASFFPTLNTKISIEGHTDNQLLNTGSLYRDNKGLSAARSLSVSRYFTDVAKLDDHLFIGTFYADAVPVAPNDTAENRAKNRRVEIIVLRNY